MTGSAPLPPNCPDCGAVMVLAVEGTELMPTAYSCPKGCHAGAYILADPWPVSVESDETVPCPRCGALVLRDSLLDNACCINCVTEDDMPF